MPFPVSIDTRELATSIEVIFTAPMPMRLTDIVIANRAATPLDVTIHIVPTGGTASNSNKILGTVTVNANDTYIRNALNFVLQLGYSIHAFASGAGVNLTGTLTDEKPR